MGIYLGQLPPAEIARLKAELAETLIANFCYPRFFDHRTEALQMRPVDRAKRQEVWLYLSSVDFTAWSRVDLMSADFQHQIERLFIQFVQRNRNFFGEQGRRRMFDIRVQISASATVVTQGLRNHLTGQKQSNPPFGSPRAVVSWATPAISGRPEPTWEQISASTMIIQQQLQEVRGEIRTSSAPVANDGRDARVQQSAPTLASMAGAMGAVSTSSSSNPVQTGYPAVPNQTQSSNVHRPMTAPAASVKPSGQPGIADYDISSVVHQPTMSIPPVSPRPVQPAAEVKIPVAPGQSASKVQSAPQAYRGSQPPVEMAQPLTSQAPQTAQPYEARTATPVARRTEAGYNQSVEQPAAFVAPAAPTRTAGGGTELNGAGSYATNGTGVRPPTSPLSDTAPTPAVSLSGSVAAIKGSATVPRRTQPSLQSATQSSTLPTSTSGPRDMMSVGEDDAAIFEQLRHQLVVWLRIEAITAGLEITNQSPTQLLELLRQQARMDETRLQVVSTLLNLANQVIKTGLVSVLDYKQALMFHLMHTRRQ
ncbi:hypothetical protein ccbrp13_59040 [Ktedonobacteria bacterium brp13]|nr:hypothetical protein ccbrp13_59040 [Ktedonobacteria bacterium brp13]